VLGCRRLLSTQPAGIEIQAYCSIIACLLISVWTERKPTLRTYEMICHYFAGLACLDELVAHLAKLKPQVAVEPNATGGAPAARLKDSCAGPLNHMMAKESRPRDRAHGGMRRCRVLSGMKTTRAGNDNAAVQGQSSGRQIYDLGGPGGLRAYARSSTAVLTKDAARTSAGHSAGRGILPNQGSLTRRHFAAIMRWYFTPFRENRPREREAFPGTYYPVARIEGGSF
jgi:hypothetical protein